MASSHAEVRVEAVTDIDVLHQLKREIATDVVVNHSITHMKNGGGILESLIGCIKSLVQSNIELHRIALGRMQTEMPPIVVTTEVMDGLRSPVVRTRHVSHHVDEFTVDAAKLKAGLEDAKEKIEALGGEQIERGVIKVLPNGVSVEPMRAGDDQVATLWMHEKTLLNLLRGNVRIANMPADAKIVSISTPCKRFGVGVRLQSVEFKKVPPCGNIPAFLAEIEEVATVKPKECDHNWEEVFDLSFVGDAHKKAVEVEIKPTIFLNQFGYPASPKLEALMRQIADSPTNQPVDVSSVCTCGGTAGAHRYPCPQWNWQ